MIVTVIEFQLDEVDLSDFLQEISAVVERRKSLGCPVWMKVQQERTGVFRPPTETEQQDIFDAIQDFRREGASLPGTPNRPAPPHTHYDNSPVAQQVQATVEAHERMEERASRHDRRSEDAKLEAEYERVNALEPPQGR